VLIVEHLGRTTVRKLQPKEEIGHRQEHVQQQLTWRQHHSLNFIGGGGGGEGGELLMLLLLLLLGNECSKVMRMVMPHLKGQRRVNADGNGGNEKQRELRERSGF